jgi:hypothetical protein
MVFAFPPCTQFAGSGARWWATKQPELLEEALDVAYACLKICVGNGAPWMLENPVGRLKNWFGKPQHYFHPHEYAGYLEGDEAEEERYTKKTCLWTGGGFVMPHKKSLTPVLGSKMHLLAPSPDRADKRSVTPMGFSRAVFEANHER